jgi:hypothetical protein
VSIHTLDHSKNTQLADVGLKAPHASTTIPTQVALDMVTAIKEERPQVTPKRSVEHHLCEIMLGLATAVTLSSLQDTGDIRYIG